MDMYASELPIDLPIFWQMERYHNCVRRHSYITCVCALLQDYVKPIIMRMVYKKMGKLYTQDKLNKAYEKSEMPMRDAYVEIYLNLSLAMFFGSGLPIIFIYCGAAFLVQYLFELHRLMRACKMPQRYSAAMGKGVFSAFPKPLNPINS